MPERHFASHRQHYTQLVQLGALLALLGAVASVLLLSDQGTRAPEAFAQQTQSITIVKDAIPDDPQDFQFISGPLVNQCTSNNFLLDDDTDPSLANSITFALAPGCNLFNTVTEIVPPGWTLTNIACIITSAPGAGPQSVITIGNDGDFDPGDTQVSIDLASDEAATCTFTNEMETPGSVTICKQTDPDGATGFNFGRSSPTIRPLPFPLDDDQCSAILNLSPNQGPYAFTEIQPLPVGWTLTYIFCSGGSSILIGSDADFDVGDIDVTINLGPGENVTCTFFNVQASRVVSGGTWGDSNCNGDTNAVDALLTQRYIVGLSVSQHEPCPNLGVDIDLILDGSNMSLLWGDFDCNGSLDAIDVLKTLREVAGLSITKAGPCAPSQPGAQLPEIDWVIICDVINGIETNCQICIFANGNPAGCLLL